MADADPTLHTKDTYRVDAGKMYHRTEQGEKVRLTKGDTFHPTLKQVADGSLENKASKVKEGKPLSFTVSADIGLRTLEWGSEVALRKALDASPRLTVEEMKAVGPTGSTGFVTADVNRALDAREG